MGLEGRELPKLFSRLTPKGKIINMPLKRGDTGITLTLIVQAQ